MTREEFFFQVYEVMNEIPYGKVTTYGQIAKLIGYPKNARMVGTALKYSQMYGEYPCYKVLGSSGKLLDGWAEQKELLEREGIQVKNNRVNLKEYLWEI